MKDAEVLTNIVAVQYPSNHSLVKGIKVLFIGKNTQWKQELTNAFVDYITDKPLTFYYVNDDKYDSDKISWIHNNLLHCDFRVMHVSNDIEDLTIIAPYVRDKNTFLLFADDCMDMIRDMYEMLNPNTISSDTLANDPRNIVLTIKQA